MQRDETIYSLRQELDEALRAKDAMSSKVQELVQTKAALLNDLERLTSQWQGLQQVKR